MSEDGRDLLFARVELLKALKERDYRFVTPTPLTHARVVARKRVAAGLRDVLGWSLPFEPDILDADIVALLNRAGALEAVGDLLKSNVRVSSLDDFLFLHSAFPTSGSDAVFFGPDSYRFATFVRAELRRFSPINCVVDIGTGTGIGGVAAMGAAQIANLVLTDVNENALDLARANVLFSSRAAGEASVRGMSIAFQNTSALDGVEGPIHAIIANPPYIEDQAHRVYRDGGGAHGGAVSIQWAKAAADRLARGGAFLLYTGSAIVDGADQLRAALCEALEGFDITYRELDPDVFGEELERDEYADVERIAVVGVVATKR
ncbi:MAG: methyltransferase [Vitreimonas sp.]